MPTNITNIYNPAQLVRYLHTKTTELAHDLSDDALEYGGWTAGLLPILSTSTQEKTIPFLPNTPSINASLNHVSTIDAITSIYSDLGLNKISFNDPIIDPNVIDLIDVKDNGLSPGDILTVAAYSSSPTDDKVIEYITMVIESGSGQLVTFPKIQQRGHSGRGGYRRQNIKYTKLYKLKKTLPSGTLAKLNTEVGQYLQYASDPNLNAEIRQLSSHTTKGFLQIGDIKFLVSPTQISFSTQNGYQYFPTIRTQGNPKIPTMQESKTINISLIFPNTASINNELLPLYAMFKRAPFVNIKNKDISNFFHELKDEEGFISVALSSINIQSVKGFPNTLQANITVLPFQRNAVGVAFKALKTFDDVRYKQLKYTYVHENFDSIVAQSQARLQEKTAYFGNDISRAGLGVDDDIGFNITSDFSYSEPFRAYYQGLLKYRTHVTDELGNLIRKTNNEVISLNPFRPMKQTSYITAYTSEANTQPFKLSYSYIDQDVREYTKSMNRRKLEARLNLSENIMDAKTALKNVVEFENNLITTIMTQQDFFDATLSQLNTVSSFITEYFQGLGLEPNNPGVKKVTDLTELCVMIVKSRLGFGGVTVEDAEFIYDASSRLLSGEQKITFAKKSRIDFTSTFTLTDSETGQNMAANTYLREIEDTLFGEIEKLKLNDDGSGETDYDKVVRFWQSIYDTISSGGDEIDMSTLLSKNIKGMATDLIDIDFINDVVDGWGVTFSNKFVPIQLLGYKYPFYQHLGSDDINLSMSITSLQNDREYGLKEQLSLLNDRLQRTTKIILMNMPELIHAYDKNLKVEHATSTTFNPIPIPDGHILSIFGLKNLIYNNSNVSTITGKPDAWSISLNFTQDNFTLQEYQSISRIDNNFSFEDDITNLIVRSEMTNNQVTVYDYVPNKEAIKTELLKTQTEEGLAISLQKILPKIDLTNNAIQNLTDGGNITDSIGPLSNSMTPRDKREINNFITSMKFAEFYTQFLRDIRTRLEDDVELDVDVLARQITVIKNVLASIDDNEQLSTLFTKVKNDADTSRLRGVLNSNNDQFKTIFKTLITRTTDLYELQANVIFQGNSSPIPLKDMPLNDWKEAVWSGANAAVYAGTFAMYGALALAYTTAGTISVGSGGLLAPIAAILVVAATVSVAYVAIEATRSAAIATENAFANGMNAITQYIKDNEKTLNKLLEGVRGSYLSQLSRLILKDPYILQQIFGDEIYEQVRANYNSFGVNCYKDFDIKATNSTDILNSTELSNQNFNFTPDFYLYDKSLSELKKEEFIRDELQNKITSSEIQANLIFQDFKKVTIKLYTDKELLFKDDTDGLYPAIMSDLKLMRNSNGTPANAAEADLNTSDDLDGLIVDLSNVYLQIVQAYSGTAEIDNGTDSDATATNALNVDGLKFNMLHVARITRILALREIQVSINAAIDSKKYDTYIESKDDDSKPNGDNKGFTLQGISQDSINKYKKYIDLYFTQYVSINTIKTAKPQVEGEGTDKSTLLYIPDAKKGSITVLETQIYTHLHQLYVLDSAIKDAIANGKMNIDLRELKDIPELELLKWYNWRSAEQNLVDAELLNSFKRFDGADISKGTGRLFPTQKIYFVEEDGKVFRNLDDYYSYDAIQSVDIVMNKYAAGRTAVLRLGNMFNNITDKISVMVESLNLQDRIDNIDDIFLGTLDIKPGTKMIIKQGYNANDKELPVVFVGKITEMKPGPVTEIIAQSYGAQLNHYIEKLNFGFLSSRNEHGDVAISILDKMISADGLGEMDPANILSTTFSAKNVGKVRENVFNKFLISNITTKLNAGLLAFDNPRDENIYLPLRLVDSVWDKITFDWRVYQQTVWQGLGELALHHRNTFPMVKLYNNDKLSSLDDLRETVIVGDKAGYYKHTDSYGFSAMHYKQIKEVIDFWNSSVSSIVLDILTQIKKNFVDKRPPTREDVYVAFWKLAQANNISDKFGAYSSSRSGIGVLVETLTHSQDTKTVSDYFGNKYMSLMIIKKYLSKTLDSKEFSTITSSLYALFGEKYKDLLTPAQIDGLNVILNVYTSPTTSVDNLMLTRRQTQNYSGAGGNSSSLGSYAINDKRFFDIIFAVLLMSYDKDTNKYDTEFISDILEIEDYLDIKPIKTNNTVRELAKDITYQKIQRHHILSDDSDIISNNIMVSQSFNNAVTVYYNEEPVYTSADANGKVYPFTIKAFGDTRDADTRVLETFQKNIDPNYFEVATKISGLVTDYYGTSDYTEPKGTDANLDTNSKHFDTTLNPVWDKLPAFYTVGLSLLQREVEQMYRGTLQIVGYPYIEPFDIIHLDDKMNNMVGTLEVEEVIHTFNPQQGFITTITPSMITYDRNPIRMAEISTMDRITRIGKDHRATYQVAAGVRSGFGAILVALGVGATVTAAVGTGFILPLILGAGTVATAIPVAKNLYGALYGKNVAYNNFLYDHFGNLFGRDCINFSALTYHGSPFMGGFGGVDYTNITSIINHQATNGGIMRRMAGSADYESNWITARGDFENMDLKTAFFNTNEWGFISPLLRGLYVTNVWGKKDKMRLTASSIGESIASRGIFPNGRP